MKKIVARDNNPVNEIKEKIWNSIELLDNSISYIDYHFVLFLLILKKKGLLDGLGDYDISDLKKEIERRIIASNDDLLTQISLYFSQNILLDDSILSSLVNQLCSFDEHVYQNNFSSLFDDLLYKLSNALGRSNGEYLLPLELSRLICHFVDLPSNANIYNPFAGVASFRVNLMHDYEYLGQEIVKTTSVFATMRLIAHDMDSNSKIELSDSILNWNPANKKYDLIIASPPFGLRLHHSIIGRFGEIKSYEHFIIDRGLDSLKLNGKLIMIVPTGFLSRSGKDLEQRKYLIDNDLVDMVISIPGGVLMNTQIPLTILFLNKSKKIKGLVKFLDAKSFVKTSTGRVKILDDYSLIAFLMGQEESDDFSIVTNSIIKKSGFSLDVPRYLLKEYDGIKLSDFVTTITGERASLYDEGKYVRIRDLKEDRLDYRLDLSLVENDEVPFRTQRIEESCLLLATRWRSLKPTYFEYTGVPIYISAEIVAIKIDQEKSYLPYLVNELYKDYVVKQLDSYRTGSVIPSISKADLGEIIIKIPSIEMQQASFKETLEGLAEEKKRDLQFFKKIHGLENEIIEQNTYLRHTLAGPTSNLKGALANLKLILYDQVQAKFPEILNLKVSDKHQNTLTQYLEILERDIARIADAVSRQLKVETDIESKELTSIEIFAFINNFVNERSERKDANFKVEFQFDEKAFFDADGNIIKTFILANESLLTDLFNNLISNAESHAFHPNGNNRIEIYLMIDTFGQQGNKIAILVSNTGTPFPEKFGIDDFIRKGAKAGLNAGDGFGGWYINEIVKKLNGEFDLIDETGPEGLPETDLATTFEIMFPIIEIQTDEEI